MLSSLPACSPPFITFIIGIGSSYRSSCPATSSQIYSYSGLFNESAAALQTAIEIPSIAFAPSFDLFSVPSSAINRSSSSFWASASIPNISGFNIVFTASTALRTPLPLYRLLSPSRLSHASLLPVDAPEGTAALPNPFSVRTSTSTVGFPRESRISLPFKPFITIGVIPKTHYYIHLILSYLMSYTGW